GAATVAADSRGHDPLAAQRAAVRRPDRANVSGPDAARMIAPVDFLVFGPHPDDLEIGLGGTIARHVALGYRVGLCDLTAGEMGSNGTVEERLAESESARAVLGADWRIN